MAEKKGILKKVVSGGQTGVDRAALDVAMHLNLEVGGWCPKNRKAEDGRIPDLYPLRETESGEYSVRTQRNVCDSDATLVLHCGSISGGTLLTVSLARANSKPVFLHDLSVNQELTEPAMRWLLDADVRELNVAGPRESEEPGIYGSARKFLLQLLSGIS